jgi:Ca-activated chloride channel family protein
MDRRFPMSIGARCEPLEKLKGQHMRTRTNWWTGTVALAIGTAAWLSPISLRAQQPQSSGQSFSFNSAVDLVAVTATVTDGSGRFVSGLRAEDFTIYENGKAQEVSQFDSERVPVSLGIVLDTSGSMAGDKMAAAQEAIGRFVDLLGPSDEMFLYRFSDEPQLVQGWTENRAGLVRRLGAVRPSGGTALYDAVAEAVPLASSGAKRKKAMVVISDGNDTNSRTPLSEVRQAIRESEVLVYAIGIDGSGNGSYGGSRQPGFPIPIPGMPPIMIPMPRRSPSPAPQRRMPGGMEDRVNASALRMITDDSGGRTEIVDSLRDLDPATEGIADELSRQYFLGYVSTLPKDGRWHEIDVRVRRGAYTVRARKGYLATPDAD